MAAVAILAAAAVLAATVVVLSSCTRSVLKETVTQAGSNEEEEVKFEASSIRPPGSCWSPASSHRHTGGRIHVGRHGRHVCLKLLYSYGK